MSNDVLTLATHIGLHVDTWSPGDGYTRYLFFKEEGDYFAGSALGTALGKREALVWLSGYRAATRVLA